MDTIVEVTVVLGKDRVEAKKKSFLFVQFKQKRIYKSTIENIWKVIDSLLADWEIRFSQTHPESEVYKLNTNMDTAVTVSPILLEMLHVGLAYGDTLQGMFDLTILPIKELWGFGEDAVKKEIPSHDTIQSALEKINYKKINIEKEKNLVLFKDNGVVIDVGGIAKGFVLREIGKLLDLYSINDYLVVAGGDIIASGTKPEGNKWCIGIQHPRHPEKPLGSFKFDRGSVVTSGDYERFWIKDGRRYHHIFNPSTGYSCNKNQSLTVWGMDPVIVDVLSTGLFCFSRDSILRFIEERPLLECLVVDSSGTIGISSGWSDKITILE
jgi:thiamine biosynthesis lipoprotein